MLTVLRAVAILSMGWARRPQLRSGGPPYSLVIEATEEADFFGFYSPDLEGFTGVGQSIADCLYKARWGMKEHVALLREHGLPIPAENPDPVITVQNAKEPVLA